MYKTIGNARWAMRFAILCVLIVGQNVSYADGVTFVHTDHLATPVAYSNAQGVVIGEESTTPYGESLNPPTSNDHPAFTGHVRDGNTGLVYMQARYYDPVVGRFLSTDPVGFENGGVNHFNRYGYSIGNPLSFVDPTGLEVVFAEGRNAQVLRNAWNNASATSPTTGGVLKFIERSDEVITVKEGASSRYSSDKKTLYVAVNDRSTSFRAQKLHLPNEKVEVDGEATEASEGRKIAHEAGHALDDLLGRSLEVDVNGNGMNDTEERASELESVYGEESGDGGERTGYTQRGEDGKVEKFEKQEDGRWTRDEE